ncbi:MAG: zinc ribbon domain-containing protein [Planctomycetes bacterium]|nr:zinc ribbon domain-containing protein [Planctomycetota bacterium]
MPTYEYECEACGVTFERFQPITAEPVRRCPECRRAKVRRLIGAGGGLLFRGSGFYITDYRSSDYQAKAKAESGSAPSGGAKPEASPKEPLKKGAAHKDGAKATK